jgi:hypothetical protein
VDAGFELEPGEHALAGDARDHLLVAAEIGGGGGDELHAPALILGITLVHADEIAREQGRLVAARAGANFEHGRALIGGVAGQQLQRERAFGLFQRRLVLVQLLRSHGAQLGIGIGRHRRERARLVAQPPHLASRRRDRLDLRIIARELHELIGAEVRRRHRILKLVPPRLDLRDAGWEMVVMSEKPELPSPQPRITSRAQQKADSLARTSKL